MSVRIAVADDHPIVRRGFVALLGGEPGYTVVAEAGDGLEALEVVEREAPDVLVCDVSMPGLHGVEVARRVTARHPGTRVVMLSMHRGEAYIAEAVRSGALGYVLKDSSPDDLLEAVRAVMRGERYLSPSLPVDLIRYYAEASAEHVRDRYATLTDREREVLQLIAEGHTSPQIAQRLFISPRTVDTHRANVMAKLGLANQAELIRYAIERGLVPLHRGPLGDSLGGG